MGPEERSTEKIASASVIVETEETQVRVTMNDVTALDKQSNLIELPSLDLQLGSRVFDEAVGRESFVEGVKDAVGSEDDDHVAAGVAEADEEKLLADDVGRCEDSEMDLRCDSAF